MLCVVAITFLFSVGNGLIMPLTKPEGRLDMSSLYSHIALLEHTIETKASSAEITELKTQLQKTEAELKETKSDLKATQIEVSVLQSQLKSVNSPGPCNCNETNAVKHTDISSIKADVSTLKTGIFHLQSQHNATGQIGIRSSGKNLEKLVYQAIIEEFNKAGRSTFTRWGRTTCPSDAKVIYKGYIGGFLYSNRASSATLLCLPDHRIYDNHTAASHGSPIYGTEYEGNYSGGPFPNLYNEDLPCVVCKMETKVSVMMVPARTQCYPEWTLEYSGYLMGGGQNHASSEYICVDKDAESIPGGHQDDDENVLYVVEGKCGSLPCPPYQNNWELTCMCSVFKVTCHDQYQRTGCCHCTLLEYIHVKI